jgi:acyl-CoA thioesterase FadM
MQTVTRVRLDISGPLPFSAELEVRITDVNYGGHLGNDALLGLLHEARVRFLRNHGWSEKNIEGVAIIMTDAVIVYRSEAFPGDRLRVEVGVRDPAATSCDIVYRVSNAGSGAPVATAKTGIAFFDYTARRVVGMPETFRARLFPGT